jgi:hypothetical protein|tara:strand:- start:232 stop:471 length:240 start_codon:yes stop_codon:yes gene_type:complete
MTEEQRVKLEELISEFEQVVLLTERDASVDDRYGRSKRGKAHDEIANHLDLIQWSAALYNLRRAGKQFDISISMDDEGK